MAVDLEKMARLFVEGLPHSQALGMRMAAIEPGIATVEMDYADHLIGDPKTGVIAGGAVSALMDTCCGVAVSSHPDHQSTTATLNLRIDYMRAAIPGQKIIARAECYRVTRSVAFVRATAYDDDAFENPVATATGAFTAKGDA